MQGGERKEGEWGKKRGGEWKGKNCLIDFGGTDAINQRIISPRRCRRLAPICVVIVLFIVGFCDVICMHCVSDAADGSRSTQSTTRRTRRCSLSMARVVRAIASVVREISNFQCGFYSFTRSLPNTGWLQTFSLFCTPSNSIKDNFRTFRRQNQEKIRNKTITKDPTTPKMCSYTSLWNVLVNKF